MVTIIKKGTTKEEIGKQIDKVVSKSPRKDIREFAGKMNIDLDPLKFQRQMRDEWP
ncbi:MAG TPA: hypothetical protein VLZ28_06805 [Daejeonella sp.]|nr:hypothetical protein [Daejeonella sp.]